MSRHRGRYDLHLHSEWSDGTDPVADLVAGVAERELAGFSVTDHDTVSAQAEAQSLAADFGLEYLTGLELSVTDEGNDIHVLVYGFDHEDRALLAELERFRSTRVSRAIGMADRLRALGCPVDIDRILADTGPGSVGRPHLARALVAAGWAQNVREAFDRYLAAGRPAYLPKFRIDPAQGIALAHEAGGIAVLAHPAAYPFPVDLQSLLRAGLDGIETAYPSWDRGTTAHWRDVARRHHLVETGGSDYHGSHRPGVPIGAATIGREMFERVLTALR